MRLALPKALDKNGDASLALVTPTVTASSTDENATSITLGDHEHAVPGDWAVAEARSGQYPIALLRRGSDVRVLVGTIDSGVREVKGYSAATRRDILTLRFGETPQQTTEEREIDRIAALSADAITPADGADDAEVARLVKLSDEL
jgi:hypothetical protein